MADYDHCQESTDPNLECIDNSNNYDQESFDCNKSHLINSMTVIGIIHL